MKKILIFTLVTLLILSSLFSCSNNQTKETEDKSSESVTETEKKKDRLPAQVVSNEGFEFLLSNDEKSYTLKSKGTCSNENITIPATFNNIPVTAIADEAFAGCTGVTEITLSEGITQIGKDAFAFSSDLQKITLPNTVTKVPERMCYGCPKLESVTFGNAVTDIGDSAFENCVAISSIALGDSVKTVGAAAFYNCTALANITLGNAIEQIKHSAFDKTAFSADPQNWQNKVLYSGNYLLKAAPEISGELTVKDGTLLIADHAAKRSAITSVKFPSSIKFIGAASFTACAGLTKIELPEGTVAIYDEAFSSCDGLTEVKLPDSLTTMGEFAFYHCSSLQEIAIPKGIISIPDQAFNECASLKNIIFHDKLTEIGVYSFANCHSLVKLILPNSLKVIGESSFYKCYNLVSLTIPKSVYKIKNWAFQYCHKLVDVKNESTINIVADPKNTTNGYAGTYALEIHNGESKIKEIDDYLFYTFENTNYLIGYVGTDSSITLPESMNSESYIIYKYAFCYNPKLEKISIPAGATAIQGYAFTGCHALTELTFGKNITSIAKTAISDCPEFKKVNFLGTEEEFKAININSTNFYLLNAQIIYNS